MTQQLTDMAHPPGLPGGQGRERPTVRGPEALGAGVSARNVPKGQPTFASLQASREIREWLPEALYALGHVIDAALAGDDSDPP